MSQQNIKFNVKTINILQDKMAKPGELTAKTKQWIADIASGKLTMSQRKVSVIERAEGSLEPVIAEAKRMNVHILKLTDDQGNVLLAGSTYPFEVLS